MWIDKRVDSERELRPRGSLNHLYGAFLPGFLWPIILLCLVLSSYLVYLRVPLCVCVNLLAKKDSREEACEQVDITPFLTSKAPHCACIARKISLTLRMRNMWSLSFICAGCSFSLAPAILEYLSTGDKPQQLSLRPNYLLPQGNQ